MNDKLGMVLRALFFIVVALVILFVEILKATRNGSGSLVNHMLSMLVFIAFLVEFLLVQDAATQVFFILMTVALIDVIGTTIGKGFAGVMKRHHMKGSQTMTHGTHEYFRHGGSIGCRKFPGRVFKNKRMAGHMGVDRVVQQGLEVFQVRPDENLLLIKGSIPGPKNGVVFVRSAVKG